MHCASLLGALALFSAVSAAPVKRDVEVETVTEVDYVVQMVTATVWVDPTEPASTSVAELTTAASLPTTTSAVVPQYKAPPPPPPPAPTTSSSTTSIAPPPPAPTTSTTAAPPPPPPPAPTTSTSVYQAPEQPNNAYVAPPPPPPAPTTPTVPAVETPPPAPPAPTTSTTAQAAAPTSGSSSPKGNTYTGDITYYAVGLGSCGNTNTDSEMVVAMSAALMNKATMCGKSITLSYGGVTQTATVVDTCPGCSSGSLDLSPALFKAIAPNGDGRVHGIEWWWN